MENGHWLGGGMGLKAGQEFVGGSESLGADCVQCGGSRGGAAPQQKDVMAAASEVISQLGSQGAGRVIGQSTDRIQGFHGRARCDDATHIW